MKLKQMRQFFMELKQMRQKVKYFFFNLILFLRKLSIVQYENVKQCK